MRDFIVMFLILVIFFCVNGLFIYAGVSVFKPDITYVQSCCLAVSIYGVGQLLNAARGGDK